MGRASDREGEDREQFLNLHQIEPQAPLLVVPLSQKWPKQSQIIFSQDFDHYHLLDIIALCYHMQFQQNPMIFNWESGRKTHFLPIFGIFGLFLAQKIFSSKIRLRHFSPLYGPSLHAKKLRKPMAGSIRTFVTDGRTGWRTDGLDRFQRTLCLSKNVQKQT